MSPGRPTSTESASTGPEALGDPTRSLGSELAAARLPQPSLLPSDWPDPHTGPTFSVADPLWLEVGLPVRGTANTALLPITCTHTSWGSVPPRRGLLSFHHPQRGHNPLPSATAHHLIRLPESYPSSPSEHASGGQSLHGPNGRWASAGVAQATGHHTGWYLAASRRIRKAQRSPYQQLPGKSL